MPVMFYRVMRPRPITIVKKYNVSNIPFRLTVKPFQDYPEIKRIPREEVTVTFAAADESEKG